MIPQVFNSMIALMLARFVLNDVPHYLFSETTHRTILIVPPFKPHKHPAEPVARVVIVPGGSRWQCVKCGKMLEAGSEAVKIGGKVYCVECARGGNPSELSTLSGFTEEEVKDIKDIAEYLRNFYASWEGREYSHEEILQQARDEFLRRKRIREGHKRSRGGNPGAREHQVTDSKGTLHTLAVRWSDRLCLHFYSLDGKPVDVDDRYGWAYRPSGSPIRDKTLKENIDLAVFGEVIPVGVDKEED